MSEGIESILITGITSLRRQRSGPKPFAKLARLAVGVSLLFAVANAPGMPRSPLPPLPELAQTLYHETFDEAYHYGMTETELVLNGCTFVESWSGYALRRSGAVVPFLVPALDSSGRTNLASSAGAIRFWFKPEWTSVSLPGGTGPGASVVLAELAAASGSQCVGIWSLQVNPDGSTLSLVAQSDSGPVQLLSTAISWQSGQWYLITLDYDPAGTALLLGDQQAAQNVNPIVIPPNVVVLGLGSTVTGNSSAGGDFEEFRSFARPLSPAELTHYYNASSRQAALGPITQAEVDARAQLFPRVLAERQLSALASPMGLAGPFGLLDGDCGCVTNGPVYLTNFLAALASDQTMTVSFCIAGGTSGIPYNIYMTTNLSNSLAQWQWTWLGVGYSCNHYTFTNQPVDQDSMPWEQLKAQWWSPGAMTPTASARCLQA